MMVWWTDDGLSRLMIPPIAKDILKRSMMD